MRLSEAQLTALEAKFSKKQYLTSKDIGTLAEELEMAETKVWEWFKNRREQEREVRREMKREAMRAEEEAALAKMAAPSDLPPLQSDSDEDSFENIDFLAEQEKLRRRSSVAKVEDEKEAVEEKNDEKVVDQDEEYEEDEEEETPAPEQKSWSLKDFDGAPVAIFPLVMVMVLCWLSSSVFSKMCRDAAVQEEMRKVLEAVQIPTPADLPFTFPSHRQLKIVGIPASNASRFHIDMVTATGDIAFHFNPRFEKEEKDNVVVCNHAVNGKWDFDQEERFRPIYSRFSFKRSEMFEVILQNRGSNFIRMRVNGKYLGDFKVRKPSFNDAVQLSIGGDVAIYSVKQKDDN